MTQRVLAAIVAVAAALGFAFAAVSTSDFVAHLDRQVHGIHCSFLPGVGAPDVSGTTGCHVTLMSPYSSVLRDSVWGGIPISLPAMAVFAYLVLFPLALIALRRTEDRRATGFLLAATTLPLLASIVMGWISLSELGAACKLCIGIYTSSTIAFVAALALFLRSGRAPATTPPRMAARGDDVPFERMGPPPRIAPRAKRFRGGTLQGGYSPEQTIPSDETVRDPVVLGHAPTIDLAAEEAAQQQQPRRLATASEMDRRGAPERRFGAAPTRPQPDGPLSWGVLGAAFGLGVLFVLLPVAAYAANAPDFERYLGACGTLPSPADPHRVLVALGPQTRPLAVTEVLDPLCPACRGFEQRFSGLDTAEQVSRRALLFPLDDQCNWMVDRAIHPGACAVSEAILCAGDDAEDVLAWAFEEQEEIRTAATADPRAAARMASTRFPALARCIGSPEVRARLNRALRWAVANQLPVLTPQVYVGETRICDADTDLGLDWTLARLLERSASR